MALVTGSLISLGEGGLRGCLLDGRRKVERVEEVDLVAVFIIITIRATSGGDDVFEGLLMSVWRQPTWMRHASLVSVVRELDVLFLVTQRLMRHLHPYQWPWSECFRGDA